MVETVGSRASEASEWGVQYQGGSGETVGSRASGASELGEQYQGGSRQKMGGGGGE